MQEQKITLKFTYLQLATMIMIIEIIANPIIKSVLQKVKIDGESNEIKDSIYEFSTRTQTILKKLKDQRPE